MRAHDRFKPMVEGEPLIVLQKPGEDPVRVDPKKGFSPGKGSASEETTSRSDRKPE